MPQLTQFLLDSIIFSMEDQNEEFSLDLQTGTVVSEEERAFLDEDKAFGEFRFLGLPAWDSSHGFQLMELFASRVRNPLYRQRLLDCLQSGRGVFRKFKDTLAEAPVLERKWFSFKDEQMKRVVITWYREHEGLLGLMELSEESEELTEDILLEDFTFGMLEEQERPALQTLEDTLLDELKQGSEEDQIGALLLEEKLTSARPIDYLCAHSGDGSLVGFIGYQKLTDKVVEVPIFGVQEAYRGLGIFRLLFDSFSRQMARERFSRILITLVSDSISLDKVLSQYGAEPLSKQLFLNIGAWNSLNRSSEEAYL